MPSFTVALMEDQSAHVIEYARRNSLSFDAVVREAVQAHMEANKPKEVEYNWHRQDGGWGRISAYSISDALYKLQHDNSKPAVTGLMLAAPKINMPKHKNSGCAYADGNCGCMLFGKGVTRCTNCPARLA